MFMRGYQYAKYIEVYQTLREYVFTAILTQKLIKAIIINLIDLTLNKSSDLCLHCLHMSYKKDNMVICVNIYSQ